MNKFKKYCVALILLCLFTFWAAILIQRSYELGISTGEVRMLNKFINEKIVNSEEVPKEYFVVNGNFKNKLVTYSLWLQGSELVLVVLSIFIISISIKEYRKESSNKRIKADEK